MTSLRSRLGANPSTPAYALSRKYWARGEWNGKNAAGKAWDQVAWDCSDESLADARARASVKAERLGRNAKSSRSRMWNPYLYTDRPLREPVLERLNDSDSSAAAVITRTAYGSEVLNTAGLMFIDVDLPPVPSSGRGLMDTAQDGCSSVPPPSQSIQAPRTKSSTLYASGRLAIPRGASAPTAPTADCVISSPPAGRILSPNRPTPFSRCSVATPATGNSARCKRASAPALPPSHGAVAAPTHQLRFPYDDAKRERAMNNWIARYEGASQRYATCQFLANVGSTMPDAEISPLITEHDTRTKATSGLPLA